MEVFSIPIEGKFILYRPLAQLAFVGNQAMADLVMALAGDAPASDSASEEAVTFLRSIDFLEPDPDPPLPPDNVFHPHTAVLLLTNRCHLRCVYCYANAGHAPVHDLPLEWAKAAIDYVCQDAIQQERSNFELAFHGGGEPTLRWQVMQESVAYARRQPLPCNISVVSNGIWSKHQQEWIIGNLNGVSISMDGSPETQDRERPFASGGGSFDQVMQTIRALDRASFPYGIRMTATRPWREQLARDVQFLCEETGCQSIQVEPAFNIDRGARRLPTQEQCDAFVEGFMAAFEIASQAKRILYYSGARPWLLSQTFCTAPYTGLVVSTSGDLVACYEVTSPSHPLASQSRLGRIENGAVVVDEDARRNLLACFAERRALCRSCFCYWHCAGDCFARTFAAEPASHKVFGARCNMNRDITAQMLLWYIKDSDGVWRGRQGAPTAKASAASALGSGTMRSDVVVISWWSNCLGLACLERLSRYTQGRTIYLVQVGKSQTQKALFRMHMPRAVVELTYPEDAPADDSQVREAIARTLLPDHAGLWYVDHDVFLQEDWEPWLRFMDEELSHSGLCLCYPRCDSGGAITSPAFWLSPKRCPPEMPDFKPVPFTASPVAKQPYLFRHNFELQMPQKDTLVLAQEFLSERGMARPFAVTRAAVTDTRQPPFPRCQHLNGLYLLSGTMPPPFLLDWARDCIGKFSTFFAQCPREWVNIEDTVLLERLREFQQTFDQI